MLLQENNISHNLFPFQARPCNWHCFPKHPTPIRKAKLVPASLAIHVIQIQIHMTIISLKHEKPACKEWLIHLVVSRGLRQLYGPLVCKELIQLESRITEWMFSLFPIFSHHKDMNFHFKHMTCLCVSSLS